MSANNGATDHFARKSSARAWQAALEAEKQLLEVLARLDRIERSAVRAAQYRRCPWCGDLCIGPACREHIDLMSTTDLLEEVLGA